MDNLKILITTIRKYVTDYRETHQVNKTDIFFLSMLEITANLTELGIESRREITKEEEENWFKGSYHLDFWDSNMNTELYIPLKQKVEELNFFRTK
jgi:hypothetical protein